MEYPFNRKQQPVRTKVRNGYGILAKYKSCDIREKILNYGCNYIQWKMYMQKEDKRKVTKSTWFTLEALWGLGELWVPRWLYFSRPLSSEFVVLDQDFLRKDPPGGPLAMNTRTHLVVHWLWIQGLTWWSTGYEYKDSPGGPLVMNTPRPLPMQRNTGSISGPGRLHMLRSN